MKMITVFVAFVALLFGAQLSQAQSRRLSKATRGEQSRTKPKKVMTQDSKPLSRVYQEIPSEPPPDIDAGVGWRYQRLTLFGPDISPSEQLERERDRQAFAWLIGEYARERESNKKWRNPPPADALGSILDKNAFGCYPRCARIWPGATSGKWQELLRSQNVPELLFTKNARVSNVAVIFGDADRSIVGDFNIAPAPDYNGPNGEIYVTLNRSLYCAPSIAGARADLDHRECFLDYWRSPSEETTQSAAEKKSRLILMSGNLYVLNFLLTEDNLKRMGFCGRELKLLPEDNPDEELNKKNKETNAGNIEGCAGFLWDYTFGFAAVRYEAAMALPVCLKETKCEENELSFLWTEHMGQFFVQTSNKEKALKRYLQFVLPKWYKLEILPDGTADEELNKKNAELNEKNVLLNELYKKYNEIWQTK